MTDPGVVTYRRCHVQLDRVVAAGEVVRWHFAGLRRPPPGVRCAFVVVDEVDVCGLVDVGCISSLKHAVRS
jgi:hypothetical protein